MGSEAIRVETVAGAKALGHPLSGSVVTLGTFDGLHLGHQRLIGEAVGRARDLGLRSVVYTFDPHPAQLLAPALTPLLLMPIGERIELMGELGVDLIVVEPFNREFASLSADEWVEGWLVAPLRPAHVVVGFNFTYGRDRVGTAEHLAQKGLEHGFGVSVVGPIELDGGVVSSSRVRELLRTGRVREAAQLLGRPFSVRGAVVVGERRGRQLGFRTANLDLGDRLFPAKGVYATKVRLASGEERDAVTNIGQRPTFGSGLAIESHLFDFEGDLYGQTIEVAFLERIRAERKFEHAGALVDQIRRDIEEARGILEGGV